MQTILSGPKLFIISACNGVCMAKAKSDCVRFVHCGGCGCPCALYSNTGSSALFFISSTHRVTLVAPSLCLSIPRKPYDLSSMLLMSFLVVRWIRSNLLPTLSLMLSNIYSKVVPCASCPAIVRRSVSESLLYPKEQLCQ